MKKGSAPGMEVSQSVRGIHAQSEEAELVRHDPMSQAALILSKGYDAIKQCLARPTAALCNVQHMQLCHQID